MFKFTPVLVFLVSCVLFFVTLATEDPTDVATITKACLNESGATMDMIRNYTPSDEEPDEEILCFIKCNFEKMGYINDDGKVCVESMKDDNFPEGSKDEKETIYQCLEQITSVETCEDAWNLEKCFVGTDNE